MSSRNRYLSPAEREQALVLHHALIAALQLIETGETSAAKLTETMRSVFAAQPGARVDYIVAVDPETLEPVEDLSHGAMLAVAAYFGATRLIDNVLV